MYAQIKHSIFVNIPHLNVEIEEYNLFREELTSALSEVQSQYETITKSCKSMLYCVHNIVS